MDDLDDLHCWFVVDHFDVCVAVIIILASVARIASSGLSRWCHGWCYWACGSGDSG